MSKKAKTEVADKSAVAITDTVLAENQAKIDNADKAIKALAAKVKGILVTELNYGQIVNEVERAAAGQCPVELCAKYDMTIFEPEEILEGIENLAGGNK